MAFEVVDDERLDRHSQLASSSIGQVFATLIVLVGAVWIVGPNIPSGPLQSDIEVLWTPAVELGLHQDWAVFAPNPRSQSIDVHARLEFDDGTTETWAIPDFDPVVGAYRKYRWHKWQERVRLDRREQHWAPTALWLAENNRRNGTLPARVTLIRRWIDHEPLGTPEPIDGDWNEFEFFVWERDQ